MAVAADAASRLPVRFDFENEWSSYDELQALPVAIFDFGVVFAKK